MFLVYTVGYLLIIWVFSAFGDLGRLPYAMVPFVAGGFWIAFVRDDEFEAAIGAQAALSAALIMGFWTSLRTMGPTQFALTHALLTLVVVAAAWTSLARRAPNSTADDYFAFIWLVVTGVAAITITTSGHPHLVLAAAFSVQMFALLAGIATSDQGTEYGF